jgi:hypothetical protein
VELRQLCREIKSSSFEKSPWLNRVKNTGKGFFCWTDRARDEATMRHGGSEREGGRSGRCGGGRSAGAARRGVWGCGDEQ